MSLPDPPATALRGVHEAHCLRLYHPKGGAPLLTQQVPPNQRPYIHPLLAPDGMGELTENEPGHHRWQHGLYTGLNAVNGYGFWTEGKYPANHAIDGSFHPAPLAAPSVRDGRVAWQVGCEWRAPGGAPLLHETQGWAYRHLGDSAVLDLTWTLQAATDLTFGQYAYGGLFLRIPYRRAVGGQACNSRGQAYPQVADQRAEWLALTMPIPGREACAEPACTLVFLDHPANPEHPAPWRVDHDLGVAPSRCLAGPWTLARGEHSTSRYRLRWWAGARSAAELATVWHDFAHEPLDPGP